MENLNSLIISLTIGPVFGFVFGRMIINKYRFKVAVDAIEHNKQVGKMIDDASWRATELKPSKKNTGGVKV